MRLGRLSDRTISLCYKAQSYPKNLQLFGVVLCFSAQCYPKNLQLFGVVRYRRQTSDVSLRQAGLSATGRRVVDGASVMNVSLKERSRVSPPRSTRSRPASPGLRDQLTQRIAVWSDRAVQSWRAEAFSVRQRSCRHEAPASEVSSPGRNWLQTAFRFAADSFPERRSASTS